MTAFANKPRTGNQCACGRPAWGKGPRCRNCITAEREKSTDYGPAEMRKDTLLADQPRLRMGAERMAREGAGFYLNPAIQEEADHNMLTQSVSTNAPKSWRAKPTTIRRTLNRANRLLIG